MKLPRKRSAIIAFGAACIIACVLLVMKCSSKPPSLFTTATVNRGDLSAAISATGTVEPEDVIDVGAQVAGRIVFFGKDKNGKEIDYGSEVEAGTVLAQIDDALYAADAAQARAAAVRAEADLGQLQAKLFQAKRDWERAQKLGPSEALAQSSYDGYKSGYEIAKANVGVGDAAILQARASIATAEAAIQKAQCQALMRPASSCLHWISSACRYGCLSTRPTSAASIWGSP
ncbi:MAG: efflux RND transporter periplasmic adaptor subunit [Proteobacteria bacterium]|nr:efflux RND transporter periplasmic adaptor subunit [Pseudomonadota bacterium]